MAQKKAKRFYTHTKRKTHEKGKRFLNTALIVLMVVSGYVALHARYSRTEGVAGFTFFFILIFGLPLFSFSLTNFVYRLRVVTRREYIAYHAVVRGMHDNRLTIFEKSKYCVFKYSNCVGMSRKDVHDTPGILIFVPDEVYFFPDKIISYNHNNDSVVEDRK